MTSRYREALQAIVALIDGEWDHPALVKEGPLLPYAEANIRAIARRAVGEPTPQDSAHWAFQAVETYAKKTGLSPEEDTETAIQDLLTDLRHLCDLQGWDFDTIDRRAWRHYYEETRGEPR